MPVPENEMDAMEIDEILQSMTIKNVGNIIVSEDYFNGKTVICERYIDTVTGDTYKYYFDNDTLVGIETYYKNEKLGSDTIIVHSITNNVDSNLFKQPSSKINIPEGLL